jgi:hypothetical protein
MLIDQRLRREKLLKKARVRAWIAWPLIILGSLLLIASCGGMAADPPQGREIAAIFEAVKSGNAALVDLMVDAGARVNGEERIGGVPGTTPLWVASYTGSPKVVQVLIDRGAEVDARSGRKDPETFSTLCGGETPLYAAAMAGHKANVQILLEAGADPAIASDSGKTPHQVAEELRILRAFRDRILVPTTYSRRFLDFYYRASPGPARWIATHPRARRVVRVFMIAPLAFVASLVLASDSCIGSDLFRIDSQNEDRRQSVPPLCNWRLK